MKEEKEKRRKRIIKILTRMLIIFLPSERIELPIQLYKSRVMPFNYEGALDVFIFFPVLLIFQKENTNSWKNAFPFFPKRKWRKNKRYSTRSAPRGIEPLFPTWRVSVLPIYEGAHYTCKRSKELNLVQQIMRLLCYLYTTSHFLKGIWLVRSNSI